MLYLRAQNNQFNIPL